MIAFAAVVAALAVLAATHVRRVHSRCTRCRHRSAIRLTDSVLFPTLYCKQVLPRMGRVVWRRTRCRHPRGRADQTSVVAPFHTSHGRGSSPLTAGQARWRSADLKAHQRLAENVDAPPGVLLRHAASR